jgi:hypothetical protein
MAARTRKSWPFRLIPVLLFSTALHQIEGLGNDPSRGSEAGAALVKWGLIGRIGVGRGWQDDEETFYHMKDAVRLSFPFATVKRQRVNLLVLLAQGL